MIKKILVALVLLYMIPAASYELGTWYLQSHGHCVGDVCMKAECPDGDSIEIPGEGTLACENFEQYADSRDSRLLQ